MVSRETTVGWFPDSDHIWVITQHLFQKEEVETGLNRAAVYIHDLDSLIKAYNLAPKHNGLPMVSCVIFNELPDLIQTYAGEVKDMLELADTVKVYEVGRESQWIKGSYMYGSLAALIKQSKGIDRTKFIVDLPQDDKQRSVMESLEADIGVAESKVKDKDSKIQELESTIQKLSMRIKDLEATIEHDYRPRESTYTQQLEQLSERLSETGIELEAERRKSYEYSEINKNLNNKSVDDNYTIEALQNKLDKSKSQVAVLQKELENRDSELTSYQKRMHGLLSTAVDGEKYVLLERELQQERDRVEQLNNEVKYASVRVREYEIDNDHLRGQISAMRKGQVTSSILGRTLTLDHYRLKNTDLVYIKVIDDLPYHRLASLMLFEELKLRYHNRVNMVIIKNDEGMDNQFFGGMPLYKDFNDLEQGVDQFRLHPHTTMFTGLDSYESEIDCLYVLDYIKNDDYLLESLARESVMTMVRRASMVKDNQLGLKGIPLTMGKESIYDLTYSPQIDSSTLQSNRHQLLRVRVQDWADRLNIRGIYD